MFCDLAVPFAAQLKKFSGLVFAVDGDMGDGDYAIEAGPARHYVTHQVFEALEGDAAPVGGLHFLFGGPLVASKNFIHARRVAAAARIFQQKRIVEIRPSLD